MSTDYISGLAQGFFGGILFALWCLGVRIIYLDVKQGREQERKALGLCEEDV